MFDVLSINMKRVYPTLVVSTMSSGKSTLINALVGEDLLPSQNRACTAKAVAILDNDRKKCFVAHMVDESGKYTLLSKVKKKDVANFNQTNHVTEMILEGQIKGIKNSKKALFIIDTPGINNSMNQTHELVTRQMLDEYAEGLILYVINAQQIGTYDDSNFLTYVVKKLSKNDKLKILFVINKMDLIDPEREDPVRLLKSCKEYIEGIGVLEPTIITVSASSALLFKKVLAGDHLSELEEKNFIRSYSFFKNDSYSLVDYVNIPEKGNMSDKIMVDGMSYSRAEIYAALYNTGLPLLETVIDETLVYSLKLRSPKVSDKK